MADKRIDQLTQLLGTALAANDEVPVSDTTAGPAAKRVTLQDMQSWFVRLTTTAYITATVTVATSSTGQRLTNRGAVIVVEFDLPAATVGQKYSFNRIAGYAVRLDPNGGVEFIGAGGAGKYLEITGRGQVDIECVTAGEWEIVGLSTTYAYEP